MQIHHIQSHARELINYASSLDCAYDKMGLHRVKIIVCAILEYFFLRYWHYFNITIHQGIYPCYKNSSYNDASEIENLEVLLYRSFETVSI